MKIRTKFPRLFQLSTQKNWKVGDVGTWENNVWKWNLKWRRPLRQNEELMAIGLKDLLDGIRLNRENNDVWRWRHAGNGMYSTSLAYKRLQSEINGAAGNSHDHDKAFKKLWSSFAPRRVPTIVWKMMRQRLPTKDNLRRRGVHFEDEEMYCVLCDDQKEESTPHILFECKAASKIWVGIHNWLKVPMVMHNNPRENFLQNRAVMRAKKEQVIADTI